MASRDTLKRSLPVEIHLRKFSDGRHLPQQAQSVEPTLFD